MPGIREFLARGFPSLRVPARCLSILGISVLCIPGISAIAISVAAWPEPVLAQAEGEGPDTTFDITWPVTGVPAVAGPLEPAEILAEVRREGFYPVSRPVHRGRVYVLFAVDQDDMDVKLTVDAASGRVLWVAEAVAHVGGPRYYGYRSLWRSERPPPMPPADIPNAGTAPRNNTRAGASLKRFPPLPRTRPAELAGNAPPAQGESQPAAFPSPVTLVPVAPLE
jgi:hypothetical protein